MIGQSHAFIKVTQLIKKIADCDVPVLLEGETGTGKELVARAIHNSGARAGCPFVPVNCGAIPDSLVENELFGHERGAYTGAQSNRPGVIAHAERGTLFLDEVEALSARAQVILLRFFQDQQYAPLGGGTTRFANVRIITASNRNLTQLVENGEFRLDLLFRLKIMHITLPPLRERRGDAALLAAHFLQVCAERFGRGQKTLHPETIAWFENYNWPGNIRELENLIYREYLLADGLTVHIAPLALANLERRRGIDRRRPKFSCSDFSEAKNQVVADFEKYFLAEALAKAQGNVTKAAIIVGKDRRALGRLLKKYSMDKSLYFANGSRLIGTE